MPQTKVCCHCKIEKNFSLFNRDKGRPDNRARICRACRAKTRKEQESKKPKKYADRKFKYNEENRKRIREYNFKRRHGITKEEVLVILDFQDGCKICKTQVPGGNGHWHVDHDHSCCGVSFSCDKCRRGILCNRCNLMIGMAKDNKEILIAGAKYLQEYEVNKYANFF